MGNKVRKLDHLRKNQSLELYNLVSLDYNEEVVQHWLKYHWSYLEAQSESNHDLQAIWLDLNNAIASLTEADQEIMYMYAGGWTLKNISLYLDKNITGGALLVRIRQMVRFLHNGELRED